MYYSIVDIVIEITLSEHFDSIWKLFEILDDIPPNRELNRINNFQLHTLWLMEPVESFPSGKS